MRGRKSLESHAAESVLLELERLYESAAEIMRKWAKGPSHRYRSERRRLFGIAYRAARKAARLSQGGK